MATTKPANSKYETAKASKVFDEDERQGSQG